MPDWVRVVLAALAVYRLAQLVTIDEGPWGLFQRLRDWAGVSDRDRNGHPTTRRGRLFGCPYCLGLWLSLPVAALVLAPSLIGDVALLWLGLAGAQTYWQGPRRPA